MRKLFAQRASAWGPGLQPCVSLSGEEFVVDLLITHWCKLLQACTLGWCWSFKRWQIVSIFLCFHVKILMRTFWPLWRKLHMQSFKSTETPVLWPPHVKSWLIGKKSDAGRDWGQEKGTTEDEMAGWHHWLDGRESEWTPGVGEGQGGLACCDSWGCKESDMTEQLIWSDLIVRAWHGHLAHRNHSVKETVPVMSSDIQIMFFN